MQRINGKEPINVVIDGLNEISKTLQRFDKNYQNQLAMAIIQTGFIENLNRFVALSSKAQQEQNQVPPQENKSCLLI